MTSNRPHPRETLLACVLIFGTVAVLYGHTLHAPFYLDDQAAILDKFLLRDLSAAVFNLFHQRGLTDFSLALNYRLTGFSLPALHLTNIALHAGSGLLVWLLLRQLLSGRWLPLLGAMLFVGHPLQTQAVTYLVQRATVLGTFFSLLALLAYLRARAALAGGCGRTSPEFSIPYALALLAGTCALLSKENTATLPLALLCYDYFFPLPVSRSWRQWLGEFLPFFVAPLVMGIAMAASVVSAGGAAVLYVPLTSLQHNNPLNYLVTQFSVVWVYLRLLVLPYGQALEHDYPVVAELLTVQNALALAGILLLLWLVWVVRHRRPLLAFGVAWFFLGLAVESSVIPLDALFEHRLYLPMFGLVLALLDGLPALLGEVRAKIICVMIVLACLPLTWQRNALWNDPIALYEDNLRNVPDSERASESLGVYYGRVGRFVEEREQLEKTIRRFPRNPVAASNLAKVYAEEERWDDALALLEEKMSLLPGCTDFYETASEISQRRGNDSLALAYLQRGLKAEGAETSRLLNDVGVLYSTRGESALAEQAFRDSLAADPASPVTMLNLGKEFYLQGRWQEAVATFASARSLAPGNSEPIEGTGHAALKLKDVDTARRMAGELESVDRAAWQRLQNAIASGVPGAAQ